MRTENNPRLKRELSRDAINLALKGEWERAAEVNRAIVELFPDDVEALNRLGKALMESAQYGEARKYLEKVVEIAPHNSIAKKNLARVAQLESAPKPCKQGSKAGRAPQLFIEESGKSGATLLHKPATGQVAARIAPGEEVNLVVDKNAIKVYTKDEEYLGQIEPKMGSRLMRLISGGNKYEAAVIGANDQGISVIIRETFRHPSLQGVCSFPSKTKEEPRAALAARLMRYIEEDNEIDEDDEEENVIDEDEIDTEDWNE